LIRLPALLLLAAGCAAAQTPYTRERALAEGAYAKGDFAGSAEHWSRARARAENAHDASEADFRRAATLERAGDLDGAAAAYLAIERSSSERADRAAFARAELALHRGDTQTGYDLLRSAFLRFPNSGMARRAARTIIARTAETRGEPAALAEAKALAERLRGTELEETLWWEHATRLEQAGEGEKALSAYLELARRFPYPRGVYWDDALLAAARRELELGRPARAVAHLERLLRERENARISGSYERKSFAEARFLIAEIARDRLRDPARARAEFRRVFVDHPTTRLGDDALFEAALISVAGRDERGACETARLIMDRAAESRYARCGHELCSALPGRAGRPCPGYAVERIQRAAQPQ
jgi:tetratricopeptide (TPR) repeat protein